jgi:phospholipase/lecithinase/hemolysin
MLASAKRVRLGWPRWAVATGLGIGVLLSASALAHPFEALYVFGDSYSDSGAGYVDGNGPTAVVYLAQSLGIPFTYAGDPAAGAKSLNFAVSGAQTGASKGVRMRPEASRCGVDEALLNRGLRTQVLDFTQRVNSRSIVFQPEKTLFFLAGGLNDHGLPTEESVENLKSEVRALYAAGGRYFLIALLPTKIPAFAEVGRRLNPALAGIAQEMRKTLAGIHIDMSHWGGYFDQILDHPGDYGIRNTTEKCAGRALFGESATPCAAPDAYFYYTDSHPSTAVQRQVAVMLREEVSRAFP